MDPDADAVPYGEFLALARDEGLVALEVQVVQAPSESNGRTAVVQATARGRDNGTFSAVGEASPRSAPDAWHPFLTTLAELRAKARALRDMTGLEHAVQEELTVPYLSMDAPGRDDADDEDDEPARPQAQRTPATPTVPRPSSPATAQPSRPPIRAIGPSTRQELDEDDGFEEDEDENEEEGGQDQEAMAAREAAHHPEPEPQEQEGGEDDVPLDFDAIPPDMLSKLIRLAISIAAEEGTEISDAEARRKLDDFFLRAFKHPLSRATRIEGQRVVQRLSGDLARRRMAPTEE